MKTTILILAALTLSSCAKSIEDVCKPKMAETLEQLGSPDKVSNVDAKVTYSYTAFELAREFTATGSSCQVYDKFTGSPLDFPIP
jgi:hypothetical protein